MEVRFEAVEMTCFDPLYVGKQHHCPSSSCNPPCDGPNAENGSLQSISEVICLLQTTDIDIDTGLLRDLSSDISRF